MNQFHWLNSSQLLIKGLGVNARNIGCGVKLNKNHRPVARGGSVGADEPPSEIKGPLF